MVKAFIQKKLFGSQNLTLTLNTIIKEYLKL